MGKYTDYTIRRAIVRDSVTTFSDKVATFPHVNTTKNYMVNCKSFDDVRELVSTVFADALETFEFDLNNVTDDDIVEAFCTAYTPRVEVRTQNGNVYRVSDGAIIGRRINGKTYRANNNGMVFKKGTFARLFHTVIDAAFCTPQRHATVREWVADDASKGIKDSECSDNLVLTHGTASVSVVEKK